MNKNYILLTVLTFMLCQISYAQKHVCGTHMSADAIHALKQNKANAAESSARNAIRYIPVTFHMVADNNGEKRVNYSAVLNQLCKMNKDYANLEMIFYLSDQGFNFIDNLGIFTNPNTASNIDKIVDNKDDDAMNIFITQNADTGNSGAGGTTLGFYTFTNDYVICRKNELVDTSSTISHEVGHFFSLNHPHAGWEDVPWSVEDYGSTVTITSIGSSQTGGQQIPVELMDKSNCEISGDLVCDTPPDYNFGFTSPGCQFVYEVYDSNSEQIFPQANNYMGYFNNCTKYEFSQEQGEIMAADFDSARRTYLRSNYVPNTSVIDDEVVLIQPTTGTQLESYNGVFLDWEPVAGADSYLIELSAGAQTLSYFSDTDEVFLTDLEPDTDYFWIIKPFNETSACVTSPSYYFKTGDTQTSTKEIAGINDIVIFPNPTNGSDMTTIDFQSELKTKVSVNIVSLSGKVVSQWISNVQVGRNTIPVSTKELSAGTYILTMSTETGRTSQKLIVQ